MSHDEALLPVNGGTSKQQLSVSPWRWLVLFAYCLMPTVQNIAYIWQSTVVNHVTVRYDVSTNAVLFYDVGDQRASSWSPPSSS